MNKSKVALVRCTSYEEDEVFSAVKRGVELLGGAREFAAAGERLLLKPNVLKGDPFERCVCTHPAVVKAVARLFQSVTASLSISDSPGHGKSLAALETCGIAETAREAGLELLDGDHGRNAGFEAPIAHAALDAQGIVNLPKLKNHSFTRMTGAVKNLYGCIPGHYKKVLHMTHPTPQEFSKMLVALNLLLKPRLHIMDGIVAMDGNGPGSGDPMPMGVLLFSTDPIALDAIMCHLVELNPLYVASARPGRARGLGTYKLEEIQLAGDSLQKSVNGDFRVARGPVAGFSTNEGITAYVNHIAGRRPVIDAKKCTLCGQCVEACPVDPKAVDWHDGNRERPPTHKYLRCIRCYCCQEICPEGAISVRKTILKL